MSTGVGYYEIPDVLLGVCYNDLPLPAQFDVISFTTDAGKDFNDTTKGVMQSQHAPGNYFDIIFRTYDVATGAATAQVAKVTSDGTITSDNFWIILAAPSVSALLDPILGPFAHAFLGGL